MKPMIPTFDEARAIAIYLSDDATLNVLQRSAAANLVNFLERSAGPALKAETAWFERHCRLTPEEAADMEVGFYGNGPIRSKAERLAIWSNTGKPE